MRDKKEGADLTPNAQDFTKDYIRVSRLCPTLLLIAVVIFLIAYAKEAVNIMYITAGVIIATSIMEVALNPIEEDENENE